MSATTRVPTTTRTTIPPDPAANRGTASTLDGRARPGLTAVEDLDQRAAATVDAAGSDRIVEPAVVVGR